jgi:integrase
MSRKYAAGSVFHRKDGRWVGAAHVKGIRRAVYGDTKAQAQRNLTDLQASLQAGIIPADGRVTVGRHVAQWLEFKRAKVRPSTWESYEGHVRIHLASISRKTLVGLTPNDVRQLVQNRLDAGCAPRTAAYTLTILRMALKQAERDGLINRNVAQLVDAPEQPKKELRILTPPEVRRLLAVESPHRHLWTILVGLGLRQGEALGLRWKDVDLLSGKLTVNVALRPLPRHARPDVPKWARTGQRLQLVAPKTDAGRRTLRLPVRVGEMLRAQRAEHADAPANINDLVFTTPKGTPLDPRNVSRAFQRDCKSAGLEPMRLHDLRHVAASQMIASGASLDDVRRTLGHSSITVTVDTYGHLVEGRDLQLPAAMDQLLG